MYVALFPAAFAQTPVILDGDVAAGMAAVSAATHIPQWELRPLPMSELLPGEGALLVGAGAGRMDCPAGVSTNTSVRELVTAAEKRLNRQEWSEMRDRLASAAGALPCLGEPAEASLMARLFFLDGFAAAELGDGVATTAAFRRAFAAQPGLAWDERLAGAGHAAFDAARAETPAKGVLALGPGFETTSTLWIDGRLVSAEHSEVPLAPGAHLIQVLQPAVRTWTATVSVGSPLALVDAGEARRRGLLGMVDAHGRIVVEAAIENALRADADALVWTGSAAWRGTKEWMSVAAAPAPPRPAQTSPVAPLLVGLGTGLLATGAATAVYGFVVAGEHYSAVPQESDQTYAIRDAWYGSASTLGATGAIVAGLGAVGLSAGLLLGPHPTSAEVWALPTATGGVFGVQGGF